MKCPRCDGTGEVAIEGMDVGELVCAHRKALKMTQMDLSKAISDLGGQMGRSQIANLEGGRTDIPIKQLAFLAKALGVSMKDLVP